MRHHTIHTNALARTRPSCLTTTFATVLLMLVSVVQARALTVTLAWDAPVIHVGQETPDGYRLSRNSVEVLRTTDTQATDALPGVGTYTYTVQAAYGEQVSLPSNAVQVAAQPVTCVYTQAGPGFSLACQNAPLPEPAAPPGPYPRLPVGAATLQSVDSQAVGYEGPLVLDGLPRTIWHTEYRTTTKPPLPHSITVDLKKILWCDGLAYLPRQDAQLTGILTSYRLETSTDLATWTMLTSGTWVMDATEKIVHFPAIQARYVRLVALVTNGTPYASAAEVGIFAVEGTP